LGPTAKYPGTKVYLATAKGVPSPATFAQLRKGVELDEGMTAPAGAELMTKAGEASYETGRSVVELRIREGLQRVSFGPVALGELALGSVRPLANDEVEALRVAGR
jgi:16S rRNA U516 pseudouridylate synthase RsuA-like enzyme